MINFEIINPNDKDKYNYTPLDYLMKYHSQPTTKNKEMFMWLSSVTDMKNLTVEGKPFMDSLNTWQIYVYNTYVRTSLIKRYEAIETST
jgi:hypothetical protein